MKLFPMNIVISGLCVLLFGCYSVTLNQTFDSTSNVLLFIESIGDESLCYVSVTDESVYALFKYPPSIQEGAFGDNLVGYDFKEGRITTGRVGMEVFNNLVSLAYDKGREELALCHRVPGPIPRSMILTFDSELNVKSEIIVDFSADHFQAHGGCYLTEENGRIHLFRSPLDVVKLEGTVAAAWNETAILVRKDAVMSLDMMTHELSIILPFPEDDVSIVPCHSDGIVGLYSQNNQMIYVVDILNQSIIDSAQNEVCPSWIIRAGKNRHDDGFSKWMLLYEFGLTSMEGNLIYAPFLLGKGSEIRCYSAIQVSDVLVVDTNIGLIQTEIHGNGADTLFDFGSADHRFIGKAERLIIAGGGRLLVYRVPVQ